MISTNLVTTLDIPSMKFKTFFFNKNIGELKDTVKAAKVFCKENKMKYLGCEVKQPYEFHSWQHNELTVFRVECTPRTSCFFYVFGRM